jgi:choline dehydrogenase
MRTFDYIVVGAGSAGCVLANRLSADPSIRVLLLEAGGSDRKLNVRIPSAFAKQFRTDLDWNYQSEPEPTLIGRSIYLPRGRSLGGSSSMNSMVYIRGHRRDYDGWADLGATGWSYPEVLPYFKRSEDNQRINDEYHGQEGPLHVSDPSWTSELAERFIASGEALGISRNDDFNGAEQDGIGVMQRTAKGGRRWSAADAFLHPVRKSRENLAVVTGAHARRVTLDGRRASGVEYDHNGRLEKARCDREVILSAGAYNSPQLLMLSGIGPADHVRSVGIEPVVDSPHVGQHLMDHPLASTTYTCTEEVTLGDATHPKYLVEYLVGRGRGKLGSSIAEAVAHVRLQQGVPAPDFQILFGPAYYSDHGFRTFPGHAFSVGPVFNRPTSEGEVRLRSPDPHDPPAVRNHWLSDSAEMRAMIEGVRLAREFAESGPLSTVAGRNIDPGPGVRSDADLEAWLRAEVQHSYHPSCTCRMGALDDGVLDERLRVRGVEGLRVADCSVMPRITSGNTNAPAIMIGERAADLVLGPDPATSQVVSQQRFEPAVP